MKQMLIAAFFLFSAPVSVAAQENDGTSQMEQGAQQFLEGLLKQMEPALEGMMDFIEQMGPAMQDILDEVKDWSVYEPPEVLPNGDIIIRRKPDAPDPNVPADEPPQVEL